MKYSSNFERDYKWFLSIAHEFKFDGNKEYLNKKGEYLIQYSSEGKDAKQCFYNYDAKGIINKTNQPEILKTLLRTKASVNLHIKMYAEDRAKGTLPKIEFDKICEEFNFPDWVINAVEQQKFKYY